MSNISIMNYKMLPIEKVELIVIISIGVFIDNIMSSTSVMSMPSRLFCYWWDLYHNYWLWIKYQNIYTHLWIIYKIVTSKENILLLCHGRRYLIVHTDHINYDKYLVITVDKNPVYYHMLLKIYLNHNVSN